MGSPLGGRGLGSATGQWFRNQSAVQLLKCRLLDPFPDLRKHSGSLGLGNSVLLKQFKKNNSFIDIL